MGWSIGFDTRWNRDIGYGVPAYCDHPACNNEIDRGLSYVCGGEPYGGESGCGLYFCDKHLSYAVSGSESRYKQRCICCIDGKAPFSPKHDHPEWIEWKLSDESWKQWREENPNEVERLSNAIQNSQQK